MESPNELRNKIIFLRYFLRRSAQNGVLNSITLQESWYLYKVISFVISFIFVSENFFYGFLIVIQRIAVLKK